VLRSLRGNNKSKTKISTKFDPINCNYVSWTFDHCECTLTYEWDKSAIDDPQKELRPVDPNVVIIGSSGVPIIHHIKCNEHAHLTDTKTHHDVVTEENWRRSDVQNTTGKIVSTFWWEGKAPNRILHIQEPSIPTELHPKVHKEISDCTTHNNYAHGKVIFH
jgi:hypothetical protein